MDKIAIAVDSPSDFPPGLVEKMGIHLLPVHIFIDGKDHLHGIDITNREVLMHLTDERDVYTKPFFPSECADHYEKLLSNYDRIFSFHASTHLSGCYNSARNALKLLPEGADKKITIIDTGCVSISQGLFVLKAIELIKKTNDPDHLKTILEPHRKNFSMWFTVDNLYWLKRAGRLNAFSALVGGALDLKPIISLENGKLIPVKKQRGSKSTMKTIIKMAVNAAEMYGAQGEIWIAHADEPENAILIQTEISRSLGKPENEFQVMEVGPTITAHTGPGSLCLAMIHRAS